MVAMSSFPGTFFARVSKIRRASAALVVLLALFAVAVGSAPQFRISVFIENHVFDANLAQASSNAFKYLSAEFKSALSRALAPHLRLRPPHHIPSVEVLRFGPAPEPGALTVTCDVKALQAEPQALQRAIRSVLDSGTVGRFRISGEKSTLAQLGASEVTTLTSAQNSVQFPLMKEFIVDPISLFAMVVDVLTRLGSAMGTLIVLMALMNMTAHQKKFQLMKEVTVGLASLFVMVVGVLTCPGSAMGALIVLMALMNMTAHQKKFQLMKEVTVDLISLFVMVVDVLTCLGSAMGTLIVPMALMNMTAHQKKVTTLK
ncbi:hypothetical protein V5799_016096 [Amblyomma americanum]|uniref:Uncharacterized protein n=1 Tax=Amblyomma americanum TaxID=6943 RepID=A0AAQ4F6Q7_AMBAM